MKIIVYPLLAAFILFAPDLIRAQGWESDSKRSTSTSKSSINVQHNLILGPTIFIDSKPPTWEYGAPWGFNLTAGYLGVIDTPSKFINISIEASGGFDLLFFDDDEISVGFDIYINPAIDFHVYIDGSFYIGPSFGLRIDLYENMYYSFPKTIFYLGGEFGFILYKGKSFGFKTGLAVLANLTSESTTFLISFKFLL